MRLWSLLAYGCEGEPKERGCERHDGVEPLPRRKLPPLDIAGSNKERKKDAYTTNSVLASELEQQRQKLGTHRMICTASTPRGRTLTRN